MSIRAHRIECIEIKKTSFSLSQDENLVNFLKQSGNNIDFDWTDIIEVPVNILEEFLSKNPSIEDSLKESLNEDILWAKEKGNEFIQYYCY